MNTFERIVIGLGGAGSATLCELASRGVCALGIDPFPIGHDQGSSHGQTRIIRQAYFEDPAYVPLLRRADQLWCEKQTQTRRRLFDRVGLIEIGPDNGVVLPGVTRSAQRHQLPIEWLEPNDVSQWHPGFNVPDGMRAVFEPTAGLLYVERCVEMYAQQARSQGAAIAVDEAVVSIDPEPSQIVVRTTRSTYAAQGAIICAGAWSPAFQLESLPLRVVRKHLHWFQTQVPSMHVDATCPVFFYELPHGFFYGFPAVNDWGVKLAEHSGGEPVRSPSELDRSFDARDCERIDAFRRQCLPDVSATRTRHAVCMYTLTPDEHFVVDHHPCLSRTVFAAGLSGHGFKFVPVLAEILVDLSLDQSTNWEIEFLSARRF